MTGFFDRFRMKRLEITGITRFDDPEFPIAAVGGPEFYAIVEHVIAAIQFGKHSFWVSVDGKAKGIVFKLDQRTRQHYLTTLDDGFPSRVLLALRECDEEAKRRPALQLTPPKAR